MKQDREAADEFRKALNLSVGLTEARRQLTELGQAR
jgi:hypothetical protein